MMNIPGLFCEVFCLFLREEKELTVKQSKQSMESSKAIMTDKAIKAKAERERLGETLHLLHI